ncbi:sulfatase [Candidatus Fermentibacteria bacterium]|nr:sulfatase [Candidatus Fermentibacteria bacterium]
MKDQLRGLWIAMRPYAFPASIMPALIAAAVLLCGCAAEHPAVVGLLDQIPEPEAAGPWRVVADIGSIDDEIRYGDQIAAIGLRAESRSLLGQGQQVELKVRASLSEDEIMLCSLFPKEPIDFSHPVVLVAKGDGDSSRSEVFLRKRTQLWLEVPHEGVTTLAIRFPLPRDEEIPIQGVRILAMPRATDNWERERARALASLDVRGFGDTPDGMLMMRKFPLSANGVTRDCVALVGQDTLSLTLPKRDVEARVQFHSAELLGIAGVRAEIWIDGQWREAPLQDSPGTRDGPWLTHTLKEPLPDRCDSLRFISEGRPSEVIAIGEPVILTRRSMPPGAYNVILIDLDTMRADRLGSHGYTTRPTSTRLDSIADEKGFFIFRKAYSAGPVTVPATAKFMTSRFLNIHTEEVVPRQYTTLSEILRKNGYYCAAFTGGGALRTPGFEQGFHEFHYPLDGYGKVEDVFPPLRAWLRGTPPRPFFLFVHTYESHVPYTRDRFCRELPRGRLGDLSAGENPIDPSSIPWQHLTPAETTYVQAAYDGGVANACDATVGLFALLDSLRFWSNTVVIVLSDHGEEFWDHSRLYAEHSASSVHTELLSVPFYLHAPGISCRGTRYVDIPISTVDLMPTVCELLGLTVPQGCDGASVRPLLEMKTQHRVVPVLALNDKCRSKTRRACLISGSMKYIAILDEKGAAGVARRDPYSLEPALYFLDEDPAETRNRLADEPGIARAMAESLQSALTRAERPLQPKTRPRIFSPTGELREQLRLLGYLSESESESDSNGDAR